MDAAFGSPMIGDISCSRHKPHDDRMRIICDLMFNDYTKLHEILQGRSCESGQCYTA